MTIQVAFQHNRIRETREALGLSRPDVLMLLLEHDLRIHDETLANWESGKTAPNSRELALLALVLKKAIGFFYLPAE